MGRYLFVLSLLLAACSSVDSLTVLHQKADPTLVDVVDRYAEAEVDTTVTIEAILIEPLRDDRRLQIISDCQIALLDRLDSTAMIRCTSRQVTCIATQSEFRSLRMVQAWSPDL